MRAYKVFAIENGTVIDHISKGCALKVINILNLQQYDQIVTVGINLESKKEGKKDIIKIEDKTLTKNELNKIALVAPDASINIIKDHKVVKKFKVNVPDEILTTIKCNNPKCITNHQGVETIFNKVSVSPLKLKCHYCERIVENSEIHLI